MERPSLWQDKEMNKNSYKLYFSSPPVLSHHLPLFTKGRLGGPGTQSHQFPLSCRRCHQGAGTIFNVSDACGRTADLTGCTSRSLLQEVHNLHRRRKRLCRCRRKRVSLVTFFDKPKKVTRAFVTLTSDPLRLPDGGHLPLVTKGRLGGPGTQSHQLPMSCRRCHQGAGTIFNVPYQVEVPQV